MSHREEARRRAEVSYALCQRAAQAGPSPDQLLASSRYGGGIGDSAQRQRAMDAREQQNHFRGEVYTAIRPIMERLGGRPIRLARIPGKGKKKRGKAVSTYVRNWFQKSSLLMGGAEPREVELIDQHPVLDAIHDPAPSIVGWSNYHLKLTTVAELCITGDAYWWFPVVKGKTEIWYLPADWVWPEHTKTQLYTAWNIQPPQAEKQQVPRESIAPFWMPDPANPLRALGPLEAGARGILISEFLEECQKRHFQLGPHPTAIVTVGGQTSTDGKMIRPRLKQWQLNQIRDNFNMQYANVFNAGKAMVLDALIDKVEPWSNQPNSMSYGENAETSRKRVRQGFGTSDYATGEGSLGSRAESAEADYHMVEFTLNPKCELISRTLTGCVLPVFDDDPSLILFLEPCEPHDHEQKAQDYQFAAKNGIININDFLVDRLGKEPVPHGDNYLVPTTYTVRTPDQMADGFTATPAGGAGGASALPAPPVTPPAPQPHETPEDQESQVAEGDEPGEAGKSKRPFDKSYGPEFYAAVSEKWLKVQGKHEESLIHDLMPLFKEQAADVLSRFDKVGLKDDGQRTAAAIFDPAEWTEQLKDAIETGLGRAMASGAKHEWDSFSEPENVKDVSGDLDFEFGADFPKNILDGIDAALKNTMSQPYWSGILTTQLSDLGDALQKAIEAGKDPREIRQDVQDVFQGQIGKERAANIARTESTSAVGAGQQAAREELAAQGIVAGKDWASTYDSRTRETHISADGQERAVDEDFDVGGYAASYPGDVRLPAKERCRCRCAALSRTIYSERGFVRLLPKCHAHETATAWPYQAT